MKTIINSIRPGIIILIIFTLLCGIIYPVTVTVFANVFFPYEAKGSIIEVDGKKYGSALVGQSFTENKYLWGRPMNIDTNGFKDENGNSLFYSRPSNLTPTSNEYKQLIEDRVSMLKETQGSTKNQSVPVDLVTGSGSGLDPHISVAAAMYQIDRIASERSISETTVKNIIEKHTEKRAFGILGEPIVNVLKVNLELDGILK